MANAELGIAKTEALRARSELSGTGDLHALQNRTAQQLGERALGYTVLTGIVVLAIVWVGNVPSGVQYGVTGLMVVALMTMVFRIHRKKVQLKNLRAAHVVHVAHATHATRSGRSEE